MLIDSKKLNHLPKITETYFGYIKQLNKEEAVKVISAKVA